MACDSKDKPKDADSSAQSQIAAEVPKPPEGSKVFFIAPKDGAVVQGPVVDGKVTVPVKMGAEKIEVKPAGEVVEGTGHHHIIIGSGAINAGIAVPADETHLHFGAGQTETDLKLAPGEHTLTMQFANGAHVSYGDKLAETIKITVAEPAQPSSDSTTGGDPK